MRKLESIAVVTGVSVFLWGCETPQFQTLKIMDQPNQVVALQVMPDANGGKKYDHPVTITTEEMMKILQGVKVKRGLFGSSTHPAFSNTEIKLFAPHFVKGLEQATPEEMVTFFEMAQLDSEHDLTTSGGLFVAGGNLYVVLSNFSVKTRAFQDNDRYEAPYRNRPLEQMDPQPGRLLFEPSEFLVESPQREIGSRFKGKPWQVAIRYKEFLQKSMSSKGN